MLRFHVGTEITTFYPNNESDNDMQTILNTVAYISKTGFDQGLQYFQSNNFTVAIKAFKQINFVAISNILSPKTLVYQIQIIKNIATFLFGPNFQQFMLHEISSSYQAVFAKYVNTFLKSVENNPRTLLAMVKHDHSYYENSKLAALRAHQGAIPDEVKFQECIIFCNHRIVGRFTRKNAAPLNCFDLFILSLFESIEFSEESSEDRSFLNPNYVTSVNPSNIQYKGGYLLVSGTVQRCSIAVSRLGNNSAYTMLFISQDTVSQQQRDLIRNIMGIIAESVMGIFKPPTNICTFQNPVTIFTQIIINRSTGESFEFAPAMSEKAEKVYNLIMRNIINKSSEAMPRGYQTMLWNDGRFTFLYEMRFENIYGVFADVETSLKNENKILVDSKNISYENIAIEIFGPAMEYSVYEIFTVFVSTIDQKSAVVLSRQFSENTIKQLSPKIDTRKRKIKSQSSLNLFSTYSSHRRMSSQPKSSRPILALGVMKTPQKNL
ncbi:hypothetical protein TVAG_497160 [Trichomonas vaginalis G3]|uniref:FUZ/MON1/HPS1 first Longin domain-containing protein n=1 Tax=Trichomonas vaginalis (strain ATCC PRA-98 / G3) TaxID=412133 RepID=A2EGV9_TRIV3|nr:Hermansky-Pudlak Syndrome protein 1 family [Trichomonas vaginalis G3]EAY08093.1 hypothetical protein TVAG_497160 [Trichomonas vaginalis G3]KAI5496692.1 Hermansky-Pudlak Syndrome protein 1 family [Trichomonas vaginalis G3]|eukprot:XP_001320316.1 hypothetical protein [Trichomonas vaginalis G3]